MPKPIDWEVLLRVFQPETPGAPNADLVTYNGERMPRDLARDLMQERAAIIEYDGGKTRKEAEALARRGLDRQPKLVHILADRFRQTPIQTPRKADR